MKQKLFKLGTAVLVTTMMLVVPIFAFASYTKFSPGATVTIGEFLFEDDFTPSTEDCTLTVRDPNGDVAVNEVTMSERPDGWHYHTFVPASITGIWPSIMSCGSGPSLVRADKTFEVGLSEVDSDGIADAVWNATTRSLTTFGSLVSDIWNAGTRTLTGIGSLAADFWNDGFAPTRRLTDSTLTGGGTLATQATVQSIADAAESSIIDEVLENRTLINALNDISAADVWAHGTRSINSGTVDLSSASQQEIWDIAVADLSTNGSVGKLLADNLDAQVSSRGISNLTAADVWSAATRTLTDYSATTVATAVWADASRTLTNYGNDITAQQVWDVLTTSLTTVGSIGEQVATNLDTTISSRASLVSQQAGWTVWMSDVDRQMATKVYRTKVVVLNSESEPTASFTVPTISLYDAERNLVVTDANMTSIATGVYEYTYTVPGVAAQGLWESIVETEVEAGKVITTNDYWEVTSSPAQVLINEVSPLTVPNISANVTITNEGLTGYEYQYEWCVVADSGNPCGGGDDIYHATAAKFINPGEDFNTNLSATVPTAGNYIFKLVVYFGLENSKASRTFTAVGGSTPPGGGGGGGGGGPASTACNGADFNGDNFVNSVDFSILLAFWRTTPPFRNNCVDINKDNQVDSIDFSILLFQWGRR